LLIIPGGLASLVIKIRDRYVTLVLAHRARTEQPLDVQPEPVPADPTPTDSQHDEPSRV
jgi:hypothetical protein